MKNHTRFALIGCGRIGGRHAEIIGQHGVLVAVCDIDEQRANAFAEKYHAEKFYKHCEMLAALQGKIDVVVICSPNGLHAAQSIDALEHGCHVLCEKPMALTSREADAMMEASHKAGKRLWVVKQNRFNPPVQAVKQMLDEGRLGKIFSVQLNCFWNRPEDYYKDSWKGTLDLDGGTLYTQFSHFVDLLIWFFGKLTPTAVQLDNFHHQNTIQFEDTGVVIGRFSSGTIASIHYTVNAYRQNMEGSITIFGERGTVKIGGQYLNELDYQQLEGEPITGLATGNPPNQYGSYVGSMSNHPLVYQNLMEVLHNNGSMINSMEEAAAAVELIEGIYCMAGRKF